MPIYRSRPKTHFTILRNAVIRDERLSGEERGLLLWLLSHSHNWRVIIPVVMRNMKWGRDKTYRVLRRLMELGYVERYQERDRQSGAYGQMVYVVRDQPLTDIPSPENCKAAKERI